MKKTILRSLALASFLITSSAAATGTIKFPVNNNPAPQTIEKSDWKGCYQGHHVPVIPQDFYDVMIVTSDGHKPSLNEVKETLTQATVNAGWEVQNPVQDAHAGKFIAFKNVKNHKHTMTAQVVYNAEKFSIVYVTSTNLAEATCGGRIFLHRNYNVWINQLKTSMSRSFSVM